MEVDHPAVAAQRYASPPSCGRNGRLLAMAPCRENREKADLDHTASAVASVAAQASDARGMATRLQRTL